MNKRLSVGFLWKSGKKKIRVGLNIKKEDSP